MASSNDSKIPFLGKPAHTLGQDDVHERAEESSDGNKIKTKSPLKPDSESINEAGKDNEPAANKEQPTVQKSWQEAMKKVDTLDDDLVQGYKEDIDTLLVFAGLFSAVVTAFTVESYQWLQEDPADTTAMLLNSTVTLLTQIVQQNNSNQSPLPSPPPAFIPTPSVVRINTFWFLSLTLSLIDALFGLLCKQWLREHQRQTNTHTPGQALALRWLRHQSFEEWHVPKILASLPILLEIALFLFFAGLLELLWTRHHIPFTIALAVVGLAVLFYIATTMLPGLSIIRQVLRIHPDFALGFALYPERIPSLPRIDLICPYKSPQSWLAFRIFSAIFHLARYTKFLNSFIKFVPSWKDQSYLFKDSISKNMLDLSDWPSLDLNVIQRFSSIERCPDLYGLKGLRWLVQETRDTPSMIPHLKNVLAGTSIHLVMPTVFGWWESPVAFDLESALESSHTVTDDLFDDRCSGDDLALTSQIVAFRHLLATSDRDSEEGEWLVSAAEELWDRRLKHPINGRFVYALFCPEESLLAPSKASRHVKLLDFYTRHWEEVNVPTQVQLVERLSRSILPSLDSLSEHDIRTTVLASRQALSFFTLVNEKICKMEEFSVWRYRVEAWMDVLRYIRRIHRLPLLYFRPIFGYFPLPMKELKSLLDESSGSKSALFERLLDSYQECWDNSNIGSTYQKEDLIKTLSSHINDTLSLPSPSSSHPTSSTNDSQPPSSIKSFIIKSQRGLNFLTFVNQKLVEEEAFHFAYRGESVAPWVDALGCVQVLLGLPSNHFKPIPKRSDYAEIVGWYTPRSERGGDNTEAEVGGGWKSTVTDAPYVGVTRHEGEVRRNEYGPPSPSSSCGKPGGGSGDSGMEMLTKDGDEGKQRVSGVEGETDNQVIAYSAMAEVGMSGVLGTDCNV